MRLKYCGDTLFDKTLCAWSEFVTPDWSPVAIVFTYVADEDGVRERVNRKLFLSFVFASLLVFRALWDLRPQSRITNFFVAWPLGFVALIASCVVILLAHFFVIGVPPFMIPVLGIFLVVAVFASLVNLFVCVCIKCDGAVSVCMKYDRVVSFFKLCSSAVATAAERYDEANRALAPKENEQERVSSAA